MKRCRICSENKKLSEFYKHSDYPDGVRHVCKDCCKKRWAYKKGMEYGYNISYLLKKKRCQEIKYFNYFLGHIIVISKNKLLAFSSLKKSKLFTDRKDARLWLIMIVQEAAKKMKHFMFTEI